MRRFSYASVVAIALLFGGAHTASAHELLPKVVVQYLKTHPNATPEELRAFALSQSPDVAAKFTNSSTEQIVRIVRGQSQTSFFDNAWDFIKLGIRHILSGPDHVLFVLTLALAFVSIAEILKLVTTFTTAHTTTLILAGTGFLLLPGRVVEPMIAVSIAVMAILPIFYGELPIFKTGWGKIAIVFFFGLFHGLGFAGLLRDIAIPDDRFLASLFSFNIGIEIGQIMILAVALPILFAVRKKSWFHVFVKIVALIIAAIALVWTIQRIFFV